MSADVWSRVLCALRTGSRLPALVETAPLGFNLDPFAHGCGQLLRELKTARGLPTADAPVADFNTKEMPRGR